MYILISQIALTEGRPDEACQKALLVMREARELPNPNLEMNAGWVALNATLQMGQDPHRLHARLKILLDELENNSRNPLLRPAFEAFAARFRPAQP